MRAGSVPDSELKIERPGCEFGWAFFVSIFCCSGFGEIVGQGEAEKAESDGTLLVVAF
jgi:hypothetical protein